MGKRRKKGRPISGWLIVDKAYDLGSTEAVSKAKMVVPGAKSRPCGHPGSSGDGRFCRSPLARRPKRFPYIMDAEKRYRFTAKWGASTTTDDAEGDIIATSDKRPNSEEIDGVLDQFIGEIDQVPPQFSAVKVGGERAYDIARDGEEVKLEPRKISVHELSVVETPSADETVFEAVTGKGRLCARLWCAIWRACLARKVM